MELDGIDGLAEGSDQTGLLATLYKSPGAVRAYGLDSGGPILPGASYTANLLHGMEGPVSDILASVPFRITSGRANWLPYRRGYNPPIRKVHR